MKSASLSSTARDVLTTAAERSGRIARAPERLPAAARSLVGASLLKAGLLEEVPAENGQPAWRSTEAGEHLALRVTAAGLSAVGLEEAGPSATALPVPSQPLASATEADAEGQGGSEPLAAGQDDATTSSAADKRRSVRTAAQAVLAAWDDTTEGRLGLPGAVDALRAALTMARPAQRSAGTLRLPRADTKRAAALLHRKEGATVAQVAEATGWATHTVRGFFTGLKKAGIPVEALERVRQVGPGKEEAMGSYTVYGITDAG